MSGCLPTDWFHVFILSHFLAVVISALSLLKGNLLFAFFIIIAEILILTVGKNQPKLLLYSADGTKFSVEGYRDYQYSDLSGFALLEDLEHPRFQELVLMPAKRFDSLVKILVPIERAGDVKSLLIQYLPVVDYKERVSTSISKRIGL